MRKNITINGVDCVSFFPKYGQSVDYKKIHGNAGGTMLDGSTTEDVIAIKAVITFNFVPQTEERMIAFLSNLYSKPYAAVTYFDPLTGKDRDIEAIYSEMSEAHLFENVYSNDMWRLHSITLTER